MGCSSGLDNSYKISKTQIEELKNSNIITSNTNKLNSVDMKKEIAILVPKQIDIDTKGKNKTSSIKNDNEFEVILDFFKTIDYYDYYEYIGKLMNESLIDKGTRNTLSFNNSENNNIQSNNKYKILFDKEDLLMVLNEIRRFNKKFFLMIKENLIHSYKGSLYEEYYSSLIEKNSFIHQPLKLIIDNHHIINNFEKSHINDNNILIKKPNKLKLVYNNPLSIIMSERFANKFDSTSIESKENKTNNPISDQQEKLSLFTINQNILDIKKLIDKINDGNIIVKTSASNTGISNMHINFDLNKLTSDLIKNKHSITIGSIISFEMELYNFITKKIEVVSFENSKILILFDYDSTKTIQKLNDLRNYTFSDNIDSNVVIPILNVEISSTFNSTDNEEIKSITDFLELTELNRNRKSNSFSVFCFIKPIKKSNSNTNKNENIFMKIFNLENDNDDQSNINFKNTSFPQYSLAENKMYIIHEYEVKVISNFLLFNNNFFSKNYVNKILLEDIKITNKSCSNMQDILLKFENIAKKSLDLLESNILKNSKEFGYKIVFYEIPNIGSSNKEFEIPIKPNIECRLGSSKKEVFDKNEINSVKIQEELINDKDYKRMSNFDLVNYDNKNINSKNNDNDIDLEVELFSDLYSRRNKKLSILRESNPKSSSELNIDNVNYKDKQKIIEKENHKKDSKELNKGDSKIINDIYDTYKHSNSNKKIIKESNLSNKKSNSNMPNMNNDLNSDIVMLNNKDKKEIKIIKIWKKLILVNMSYDIKDKVIKEEMIKIIDSELGININHNNKDNKKNVDNLNLYLEEYGAHICFNIIEKEKNEHEEFMKCLKILLDSTSIIREKSINGINNDNNDSINIIKANKDEKLKLFFEYVNSDAILDPFKLEGLIKILSNQCFSNPNISQYKFDFTIISTNIKINRLDNLITENNKEISISFNYQENERIHDLNSNKFLSDQRNINQIKNYSDCVLILINSHSINDNNIENLSILLYFLETRQIKTGERTLTSKDLRRKPNTNKSSENSNLDYLVIFQGDYETEFSKFLFKLQISLSRSLKLNNNKNSNEDPKFMERNIFSNVYFSSDYDFNLKLGFYKTDFIICMVFIESKVSENKECDSKISFLKFINDDELKIMAMEVIKNVEKDNLKTIFKRIDIKIIDKTENIELMKLIKEDIENVKKNKKEENLNSFVKNFYKCSFYYENTLILSNGKMLEQLSKKIFKVYTSNDSNMNLNLLNLKSNIDIIIPLNISKKVFLNKNCDFCDQLFDYLCLDCSFKSCGKCFERMNNSSRNLTNINNLQDLKIALNLNNMIFVDNNDNEDLSEFFINTNSNKDKIDEPNIKDTSLILKQKELKTKEKDFTKEVDLKCKCIKHIFIYCKLKEETYNNKYVNFFSLDNDIFNFLKKEKKVFKCCSCEEYSYMDEIINNEKYILISDLYEFENESESGDGKLVFSLCKTCFINYDKESNISKLKEKAEKNDKILKDLNQLRKYDNTNLEIENLEREFLRRKKELILLRIDI